MLVLRPCIVFTPGPLFPITQLHLYCFLNAASAYECLVYKRLFTPGFCLVRSLDRSWNPNVLFAEDSNGWLEFCKGFIGKENSLHPFPGIPPFLFCFRHNYPFSF